VDGMEKLLISSLLLMGICKSFLIFSVFVLVFYSICCLLLSDVMLVLFGYQHENAGMRL
jgi:hypothetical protein